MNDYFEDGSLRMWFEQIEKKPLLTKEKEKKALEKINVLKQECVNIYFLSDNFLKKIRKEYFSSFERGVFDYLFSDFKGRVSENKIKEFAYWNTNVKNKSPLVFLESGEMLISNWVNKRLCIFYSYLDKSQDLSKNFEKIKSLLKDISGVFEESLEMLLNEKKNFIEANLKLSLKIAIKYKKKNPSISLLDLVQEGNLGLMKALDKFNTNEKTKFSTYAYCWVCEYINKFIGKNCKLVNMPKHAVQRMSVIAEFKKDYLSEFGSIPSYSEISSATNIKKEYVLSIESAAMGSLSLDSCISKENDERDIFSIKDFLRDESPSQVDFFEMSQKNQLAHSIISGLNEKERKIISMRYGINPDNEIYTLETVGNEIGISKERVRQIEQGIFDKIRENEEIVSMAKEFDLF